MFWETTCGQRYIRNDGTSVRSSGGNSFVDLRLRLSRCCWVQPLHLFRNIAPIKRGLFNSFLDLRLRLSRFCWVQPLHLLRNITPIKRGLGNIFLDLRLRLSRC